MAPLIITAQPEPQLELSVKSCFENISMLGAKGKGGVGGRGCRVLSKVIL